MSVGLLRLLLLLLLRPPVPAINPATYGSGLQRKKRTAVADTARNSLEQATILKKTLTAYCQKQGAKALNSGIVSRFKWQSVPSEFLQ
jgi:hypothetical protein